MLADTSYRVIGFIIFSAGSSLTSSGVSIIWEYAKKLFVKSRTRSRSRPRI